MSISSRLFNSSSSSTTVCEPQIHAVRGQSHNAFPATTILACNKALSTQVICLNIFAFLPVPSLANNCCVNKNWRNWASDKNIWQALLPQDVRDDFTPLAIQNLIQWKEVHLYGRLSRFIAKIIEMRSKSDFIALKNPTLQYYVPSERPSFMPEPFVLSGNCHFAICNLTNIEVNEGGNSEPFFLKDEENKKLTHLAIEGDNVFALRNEGIIVQWDFKKRTKIKEIPTTYFTDEIWRSSAIFRSSFRQFYIKNGIIIITWPLDGTSLEIIPYNDPAKSQVIKNISSYSSFDFIKVLKNNQIIIMGHDINRMGYTPIEEVIPAGVSKEEFTKDVPNCPRESRIFVHKYKLSHHETDMLPSHHLLWTTSSQHTFDRITDLSRQIPVVDLKTGETVCSADNSWSWLNTHEVVENLVFTASFNANYHNPKVHVNVLKIDTENTWRVAHLEEPIPLHSDDPTWRVNFHKRLLSIAKTALNDLNFESAIPANSPRVSKKEFSKELPNSSREAGIAVTSTTVTTLSPKQPKHQFNPKRETQSKGCLIA